MQNLVHFQEKKMTKLFLYFFYIVYFSYEVLYRYVFPYLNNDPNFGFCDYSLRYLFYAILIALLPIAIYLMRINKVSTIKYLFFIVYTILSIFTEIFLFSAKSGGNILELVIVLLSPIFVSRKFFWVVSIGTILKYSIVGLVTHNGAVIIPILIVIALSIASFVILTSFIGYANSITNSYRDKLEAIVKSVISSIELKDKYTKGHSERVAKYAILLAEKSGLYSKDQLECFNYSCLLHDVGKIHIPDYILLKPEKLTNDEYEIVKKHPIAGAEALEGIEGLDMDVIKYHHERWDGKGYPEGIKESEIPVSSRIVAIADAFDAMTSTRSYRQALTAEEAYNRILESSGTQFDPEVVKLFEEVYFSWLKIMHNQL